MKHLSIGEGIGIGITGFMTYLAGLNWTVLIIWIAICTLDIVSGIIKGRVLEWDSRKFKNGLYLKVYELVLMGALILFDLALISVDIGFSLGVYLTVAFILVDIKSIVENGAAIKYRFPRLIRVAIEKADLLINGHLDDKKDDKGDADESTD